MTTSLKDLLERVESWPEAAQNELVAVANQIESELQGDYVATQEELRIIDAAIASIDAGEFASDEEVAAAVAYAYRELKLVVEPGGAVGLAALLAGRIDVKGKNVVIVLSGGNVDAELFAKLVA